jgi:hypothetical protein
VDQARSPIVVLGNRHAMHEAWCLSSPHAAANAPHGEMFGASKGWPHSYVRCLGVLSQGGAWRSIQEIRRAGTTREVSTYHCPSSAPAFNRERSTH